MRREAAVTGKPRISDRLKVAIGSMVERGLSRCEAAKLAGLSDHSLYCALRKPHVLAYRCERMEVLRTSEAARTIHRVAALAGGASSEHVRLKANQYLLEIAGIGSNSHSQPLTHHVSRALPGLTIIYDSLAQDEDT